MSKRMTKEEAIEELKARKEHYEMGDGCEFLVEALDKGIKALEQERSRSAEITQYRYDCEKLMEENERLKKALEQEPILEKIRAEIEQLPTNTRTNWDGCCPDIDYPEIEYVDVSKNKLLSIIDKYKSESER